MATTETTPGVTPLVELGPKNVKRVGRKGLAVVEEMAREGATNTAIAKALKMYRGTFADILKRQPEVEEALVRGRAEMEGELTDLLLTAARKGNVVAAIYLTKARCAWREGDAPQTNIQINTTAPEVVDVTPVAQRIDAMLADLRNREAAE